MLPGSQRAALPQTADAWARIDAAGVVAPPPAGGESRRRHGDDGQQKLDRKGERRAETAQPAQQRRSRLAFCPSPLTAPLAHEIQVGGMNGPAL